MSLHHRSRTLRARGHPWREHPTRDGLPRLHGLIVIVAVLVTPPKVAVSMAVTVLAGFVILIVKFVVDVPLAITTGLVTVA